MNPMPNEPSPYVPNFNEKKMSRLISEIILEKSNFQMAWSFKNFFQFLRDDCPDILCNMAMKIKFIRLRYWC